MAIVALIGLFLFRRRYVPQSGFDIFPPIIEAACHRRDRLGFGKSRIVDLSDRYVEYADDDSPKYGAYGMGAAGSGHGITPCKPPNSPRTISESMLTIRSCRSIDSVN